MRIEGNAAELGDLLFPDGLIPEILKLVRDVWKSLTHLKATDGEIKITRLLARAMQWEKRKRGLRFTVRSHSEELNKLSKDTGKGFSVIDIMLRHGYDERCYFAFEAKKLHSTTKSGKWKPGSGAYVGGPGMGGFIDGTYACEQTFGGMLGYVMDSDCRRAKKRVAHSMKKKVRELRMPSVCHLEPSRHFPNFPYMFETRHHLERGEFIIFHILLAA